MRHEGATGGRQALRANSAHAQISPFGAEIVQEGVRFRLWAPAARSVSVVLDGGRQEVPLAAGLDGFWEVVVPGEGAGTRYLFRVETHVTLLVPDPASRFQPDDVDGESEVVDPASYRWRDAAWRGRPWSEAVLYELHVGCFTLEGTFASARAKLDDLAETGTTALSLMPLAEFPGGRSWGYDGVLPFAPGSSYGRPGDLKEFIDAAHRRGLMVLVDVVYNHFGPEGNWLGHYAPAFFTSLHATPWGPAIDFAQPVVREFFIRNALSWIEEYHADGLRLDAVHAIFDDSPVHVLVELARRVRNGPGRERHVHLVLENVNNQARFLEEDPEAGGRLYDAQWNDDVHHALHVLLTGESGGYYQDFARDPAARLARSLAEGFAFQGEPFAPARGRPRGEPSGHLPPTAFVSFLQNHDQIGNRAFGERLTRLADPRALRAARTLLLLAPFPPLIFMGEEWAARTPFLYFCSFGPELAALVAEGRRGEFAHFENFAHPERRLLIPDPNDPKTRDASVLDWAERALPDHRDSLEFTREMLRLRRQHVAPRLRGISGHASVARVIGPKAVQARWRMGDGSNLVIACNLGDAPAPLDPVPAGRRIDLTPEAEGAISSGRIGPLATEAWIVEAG